MVTQLIPYFPPSKPSKSPGWPHQHLPGVGHSRVPGLSCAKATKAKPRKPWSHDQKILPRYGVIHGDPISNWSQIENWWKKWWKKWWKMKWMLDPEKTSLPWSGVAGRLSGNETGPGTQDWPSWKIKTARYALALRASVGKKNQTSRNQLWSKAPDVGSQNLGCMLII